MTRTARTARHHDPLVVGLMIALVICALIGVAAIRAGGPAEQSRVCVSSAAASAGADGNVVETETAVDCDP
jgi:hypothetical protein